jgi:hypothetical protein
MGRYKTRPMIVDAFRLGHEPIPEWFLVGLSYDEQAGLIENARQGCYLNTRTGTEWIPAGEYICKTEHGEVYHKIEQIFKRTHDAV